MTEPQPHGNDQAEPRSMARPETSSSKPVSPSPSSVSPSSPSSLASGGLAQCLISFGSNLGDRRERISEAARMIAGEPEVERFGASRLYETPPVGGPGGQEPFLNAVAAFDTRASAASILQMLQGIEDRLGRKRKERWGSRSIDLDVVLHGELIGGRTGLVVPHPRYTARRFVLRPACDIAGHYRDPRFGWTLRQLADHLDQGVPSMALAGGTEAQRSELCRRLQEEHQMAIFHAKPMAKPMGVIGNAPLRQQSISSEVKAGATSQGQGVPPPSHPIDAQEAQRHALWLSAFVPSLPPVGSEEANAPNTPRLIVRLQHTAPKNRWPAPHQMWPAGWDWPEYRLELDDFDWATSEVVSAFVAMRCPLTAVSEDGNWWC